jgi:hypothetical protein
MATLAGAVTSSTDTTQDTTGTRDRVTRRTAPIQEGRR